MRRVLQRLPAATRRGSLAAPRLQQVRLIVIDRASFDAEELRRAPKTGQRTVGGGAEGAAIPSLRQPVAVPADLGDSELRQLLAEKTKELDWTRERLMSMTEEASQAASTAPADSVPRDVCVSGGFCLARRSAQR
jgi:hypothetical protein